uniref:Uncharacterized protein n=1 Tax=Oryza punctata TaxID=4537 RepID=A0A0E0LBZ8_ORYPU
MSVQAQENKYYEQPSVDTVKGHIVPPATAQTYGTNTNRASNARRTTAHPNCKETQCPQQVSLGLVHKTAINSSDASHFAPIQMSSSKPQIGDTLSEKVLPATAAKSIVVLPWQVSKQSSTSGETSASKK